MRKGYLAVCCALALVSPLSGETRANYTAFENILLSREALSVRCFIQDRQGLLWIGSSKGLFSYDGYTPHPHFSYGDATNIPVNCAVLYGDDSLLLGSQRGLLVYNYKTDAFEPSFLNLPDEIQSLELTGNVLWIGAMSGLYRHEMDTRRTEKIEISSQAVKHSEIVYSLQEVDGFIYAGTYFGFGRYSPADKRFHLILPDESRNGKPVFVNSILKDESRCCIWIGTENSLMKYDLHDHSLAYKKSYSCVKTICLDQANNIVIGTDNGLYYYKDGEIESIKHDSRDARSLSNNIIWAIFKDSSQNLWIGSDYGISLLQGNRRFCFIPIHQMTASGEGNLFYSISKDSEGNFWFGGTNGLIRTKNPESGDAVRWFTVNNRDARLSHNHVRCLFEDRSRDFWVGTDGGLNRYNPQTNRFDWYHVTDSSGIFHSGWTYNMAEDAENNFWIATCMSGLLKISGKKLKQRAAFPYIADTCYTTASGLAGNFVNGLAIDRQGNVWALIYNTGIDKINTQTGRIEHIPLPDASDGGLPVWMLCDAEGFLWVACRAGLMRINTLTHEIRTANFSRTPGEPLAIMEAERAVWTSTTRGIWIVDKDSLTVRRLNADRTFYSMYYDKDLRRILLGTADGVSFRESEWTDADSAGKEKPIVVTAFHTNYTDEYSPKPQRFAKSVRYLDEIRLPYWQNSFSLEISGLDYLPEQRSTFIYKWSHSDAWQMLKADENRLSFARLEWGKHSLLISRLGLNGQPSGLVKTLGISIEPPWYFSIPAKGIYGLLLAVFLALAVYFLKIRNQLRFERMEKEKTMEQIRFKLDFFTEISHEFKTPLSLIIAPVSQILLKTEPQSKDEKALKLIYQNAMKLTSLVNQAIDFYHYGGASMELIRSRVEFVGFARAIFHTYEESMKDRHISFIFHANVDKLVIDVDVAKMESALNNLLTNACKFTGEGESVMLSLQYAPESQSLEMKVSDTGRGIPRQDLPFVFQRFFQSSVKSHRQEGTGMGLYVVKKIVKLHGGVIQVDSDEEMGASFTIRLAVGQIAGADNEREALRIDPDEPAGKPLAVIVDDHMDMVDFICNLFRNDYRCIPAYNGKTGLKLAMELHPDLIIADVMTPVMDGLEMVRRLKAHVPTAIIPLILLTAKDDKTTELNSIRLHIDAFMPKPFDPAILLSRAKQLTDKKKTLEKKLRIEIMSDPRTDNPMSQAEKLLASITRMIEENISEPDFNVNALCEKTGESQKQLYRKIKQLTGLTTIEYIKSIKLKKAAMLLDSKKFTVSEVMYMVGFNNHSYFAKCFQARFGKKPGQYPG
jgi:signal transduction histidine kinase/ligand-binding sensor domain-containing protein/DNA-binding response OmpR family regulator